jgi:hypothetical protein
MKGHYLRVLPAFFILHSFRVTFFTLGSRLFQSSCKINNNVIWIVSSKTSFAVFRRSSFGGIAGQIVAGFFLFLEENLQRAAVMTRSIRQNDAWYSKMVAGDARRNRAQLAALNEKAAKAAGEYAKVEKEMCSAGKFLELSPHAIAMFCKCQCHPGSVGLYQLIITFLIVQDLGANWPYPS